MSPAYWLKGAILGLVLGVWVLGTWPAAAQAPTAPDLSQFCARPGNHPLCVFKAYLACVVYDAPALCATAGLEGVTERFPGPDTLDSQVLTVPWTLSMERLMPEAFALHFYDAGFVSPARFEGAAFITGAPAELGGEVFELVLDIPEPYVKGLVYHLSAFFQRAGDSWRMVAWSSSRKGACEDAAASWGPCKWFLKNLKERDVRADGVKQIWASPTPPGRDDYPHPGLELNMGMPNQPIVAPFAGTIQRRSLKYPDTPLYDWVVIQGDGNRANMTAKLALIGRDGPPAGAHVDSAARLGKPQWVDAEHPGTGKFIHIELLRDGHQIDPRTVMRERKAEEPGN